MTLNTLLTYLANEMSGLRAKNAVCRIAQFHRIQASPGYDAALDTVAAELDQMGIRYEISQFEADGEMSTFGWTSPPGWTIRSGALDQMGPHERRLASFDVVHQSVLGQSAPGDLSGEVVHVGAGDSEACFEGEDLRGKFLLTHGRPADMLRMLKDKGIAGIILYPDSQRAAASYDLVQYAGLFPHKRDLAWLPMGFSISRRDADALIQDLRQGVVRVRGHVDAEFIDNPMRVLEATIRGSDESAGDVLLTAHLCHPAQSANDNASGSGLLLEIARVLAKLADQGKLSNSVHFVWIPEFNGSVPWAAANAGNLSNVLFSINLDMVGQSPELVGEPLRVFRIPNSHPIFVNACFEPLLQAIAGDSRCLAKQGSRRPLHWVLDAPTGGSDHLVLQAPPASIPSAMFGHDDPYWHTSLDTLEKVDPSRLKAVGIFTAVLSLLPTWAAHEAGLLAGWVLSYSQRALADAAHLAQQSDDSVLQLLDTARSIESARVDSLLRVLKDYDCLPLLNALQSTLDALAVNLPAALQQTNQGPAQSRPTRILNGPVSRNALSTLSVDDREYLELVWSTHHGEPLQTLTNLCDGSRTIEEIAAHLSLDFGRVVAMDDTCRAVTILGSIGYIDIA